MALEDGGPRSAQAAALRYRQQLNSAVLDLFSVVRMVETRIPGEHLGSLAEALDVAIERKGKVLTVDRITVEDPVVRDQTYAAPDQQVFEHQAIRFMCIIARRPDCVQEQDEQLRRLGASARP